ncbi:MAG: DUF5816 domain-containing protein [Halolamina sp.]
MTLSAVEVDGAGTLYVDRGAGEVGSKAPFYVVYGAEAATEEDRHGFLCGNCETMDNAMGTMGRIECNACGNIRKPEEWDAAHE